jgi:hypothetical protein
MSDSEDEDAAAKAKQQGCVLVWKVNENTVKGA